MDTTRHKNKAAEAEIDKNQILKQIKSYHKMEDKIRNQQDKSMIGNYDESKTERRLNRTLNTID